MLKLPAANHPLRETFDTASLVNYQDLPTLRVALAACRKAVEQDGVSGAWGLVLACDGKIKLIHVGSRGGWRVRWVFGRPV